MTKLQARALEQIDNATSLKDIAYLVKSLSDSGAFTDNIGIAVEAKIDSLAPTSNIKDTAYLIKALENVKLYSSEIYDIGKPGEIGFGVATCPSYLLPSGWVGMSGHDDIASPNYGNYIDANGSILVYIPKHYYKWSGNELYISGQPASGYVIDRSFINGGKEVHGVFIYKYGASNLNGIFGSQRYADPLSTNSSHNPISALNNTPANNYGGLYKAVKSAGDEYYLTSIFNYSMLARLAFAHGKAATSTAACAYIDVNPKMPKGCLVSALHDVNDTNVTYSSSGYSDCGLTGSGSPFAKTTHNGQECGIADLNGNMWEVASGFICLTSSGADGSSLQSDDFLILKESTDITSIVDDSTTAGTGAYDSGIYDQIDLSGIVDGNNGWTYYGNGTNTVFGMSTDRTTAEYRKTSLGIPNNDGVSSSGTTEFGNDGLYRYLRNEMACIMGGNWRSSSFAGVFTMSLYHYRTDSSGSVGGRASVLV